MSKILITYISFVTACVLVILAFITATTYLQLTVAILLYPLLILFAYKVAPRKLMFSEVKTTQSLQPIVDDTKDINPLRNETIGISDIDKRVFLKLIGGAGLFLFLFSLFNKRGENLFFKSLPTSGLVTLADSNGKKIDPAQDQPLDGYTISELINDTISFYGFTNKDGSWYVMRVDTTSGSFRYTRGSSDFPGNWSKRENLSYDYFSNVF
jgi:hypothetical protein